MTDISEAATKVSTDGDEDAISPPVPGDEFVDDGRGFDDDDGQLSSLEAGAALVTMGFTIIPLDHPSHIKCRGSHTRSVCDGTRGKHPLGSWEKTACRTYEDIAGWAAGRSVNWGILTGSRSNLLALDEDQLGQMQVLCDSLNIPVPDTKRIGTGRVGGGQHFWFRPPVSSTTRIGTRLAGLNIDWRGEGGMVIAPGSLHASGVTYTDLTPSAPIRPLPDELIALLREEPTRQAARRKEARERDKAEGRGKSGHKTPLTRTGESEYGVGNRDQKIFSYSVWTKKADISPQRAEELLYNEWLKLEQPDSDTYPWDLALSKLHRVHSSEDYAGDSGRDVYDPQEEQRIAWAKSLAREDIDIMPADEQKLVTEILDAAVLRHLAEQAEQAKADRAQKRLERARRTARRELDAEELERARGPRKKQTIGEFARQPKVGMVMDSVLAAEVNLLGGPSGEGKSLQARDWALSVASGMPWRGYRVPEPRNVLWVASEGTHDTEERWTRQPLYNLAQSRLFIDPEPVSLVSTHDVRWLIEEYADERPGLVVFDVIYGMGMEDDNGSKDALPVLNAMKKISQAFGGATLALGHPPHDNAGRRFRGSSMWRQLAAVEWHMADGSLTCEKSKIAHAGGMKTAYEVTYPDVRFMDAGQVLGKEAMNRSIIERSILENPGMSDNKRAQALESATGLGLSTLRKRISAQRHEYEENLSTD